MTKRENQLKLTRNRIARLEASRQAAILALVKATIELPKLRKEEARLETALAKRNAIKQAAPMGMVNDGEVVVPVPAAPEDDDLPDFLRRGMAAQKAVDDETARAEILMQQAAEKKRKDARRIEKIKIAQEIKDAELTGARRKLPLTGRAALAAIREGDSR